MTDVAGSRPTEHELRILRLYAELGSTKAVAERLEIADQTVKNTLWKIRMRLEVPTTVQAVWALRSSLEAIQ